MQQANYAEEVRATLRNRTVIARKPMLRRWYERMYGTFRAQCSSIGSGRGVCLELGSGGGFLKEVFPAVITSDILPLPDVDQVFSAEGLPFADGSLACILLLNVFHHIPNPALFLEEASRTLADGGRVVMVEPANSPLGRFIYKRFHHEPFDERGGWEIEAGRPLTHSNQALPHIYFERDVERFRERFPDLTLLSIQYHSPFTYLLTGGLSRWSLIPSFLTKPVEIFERWSKPLHPYIGLFCTVVLERRSRRKGAIVEGSPG